jgi:peptide/nickel transport system substrate-binding protein
LTQALRNSVAQARRRQVLARVLLVLICNSVPGVANTQAIDSPIRIGITAPPPSKGNPFGALSEPSIHTWDAIFDALTVYESQSQPQPGLATGWEQTGPLKWRFRLRDQVRFHNGELLDADAVKATLDYLSSPEGQATTVGREVAGLKRVIATDDSTLVIETQEPDPILPGRLALVPIVAPLAWSELGPAGYAEYPIGTGPYELTSWGVANASIELNPRPDSYRARSEMMPIELRPILDIGGRIAALRSGGVDIVIGLSPDDWGRLEGEGFRRVIDVQSQIMSLAFRTVGNTNSPIRSAAIRRALNMAIDRDLIASALYADLVEPATQGAVLSVNGFNPDLPPFPFEPDRAREIIVEEGYPNGFKMNIDVFQSTTSSLLEYQYVAQALERIGVTVTLRQIAFADWLRRYHSGDWGDTDAFSLVWNTQAVRDAIRPMEYFSCLKNPPFFCEQALMPKIMAIKTELDSQQRTQALQDMQYDLRDLSPSIMLMPRVNIIAYSDRIQSLPLRNSVVLYSDVRLQ